MTAAGATAWRRASQRRQRVQSCVPQQHTSGVLLRLPHGACNARGATRVVTSQRHAQNLARACTAADVCIMGRLHTQRTQHALRVRVAEAATGQHLLGARDRRGTQRCRCCPPPPPACAAVARCIERTCRDAPAIRAARAHTLAATHAACALLQCASATCRSRKPLLLLWPAAVVGRRCLAAAEKDERGMHTRCTQGRHARRNTRGWGCHCCHVRARCTRRRVRA